MVDVADVAVVLAELQVAFLGSVIVSDWVRAVGYSLVFQILLQTFVKASIVVSLSAWTSLLVYY